MNSNLPNYFSALNDFSEARMRASMQEVLARITGKSNELLSYEEVAEKLKLNVRTEKGVFDIPLNAIVGSVGRYSDFTRSFLPLMNNAIERERWARVKAVMDDPGSTGWPPIDVYKVGDVYFVLDGNHRVSVARLEGFTSIQAHVIEVKTDIPLTPDVIADDLIIKAEYADFLAQTDFHTVRPGVDLSLTVPGQYPRLLEHIAVHKYFMGLDFNRDISYFEAEGHWYDTVYLPIVEPLRERGLLRWFPGRTETDLYLWVSEHRAALEKELGWSVRPEAAVVDLAAQENPQAENDVRDTGSWRLAKIADRYTDHIFHDILVPLDGEPQSWVALDQALYIARTEKAFLHGIHVIPPNSKADEARVEGIRSRFAESCLSADLDGSLFVEQGSVQDQVVHRALLTDLVVLHVAHPPSAGLASIGSGLRNIIRRSARPILTVPDKFSPMDNILIAFDGSSKAREAIFVAAYLVEKFKATLTVLTIADDLETPIQDYAREYLELHEIQANFRVIPGAHETFLDVIREQGINLVVMGGYSGSAWQEVIIGSAVNFLLRQAECPLLICR